MGDFLLSVTSYLTGIRLPYFTWSDIVEILLIAFFVYEFMLWIRNTRAYSLLKGILIVLAFIFIAFLLKMNTILWLVTNMAGYAITAVLIIFQPELRKALEELGHKKIVSSIIPFDSGNKEEDGYFSDKTINEIVRASFEMGAVKTGALIVIEEETILNEYARTGIYLDSLVSSQLLINIFEHNTPLHDGAVIIRDGIILAAGCFLPRPQKDELINKQLGSRHRAAIGMSENSDAIVVVVSEETGNISVAENGELTRGYSKDSLKRLLDNRLLPEKDANSIRENSFAGRVISKWKK